MDNVEIVTEEKKPKTPKELTKLILTIVGNVVFYAIIIFLLLFSIMNINGGSQKEGAQSFPNIFGRGFLIPISDSMDVEVKEGKEYVYKNENYSIGTFKPKEDLLNVKVFKEKDFKSLKVGDVITFYDSKLNNGKGGLNTHRIIEIRDKDVITQGDKKAQSMYNLNMTRYQDADETKQYMYQNDGTVELVAADQIKGVVTSINYGGGTFQLWVRNNWLWIFVLPIGLFLLFEIFMVVKNIMDLKGAKQKEALASDKEAMMADLEKEKEAMRAQILAELRAAQGLPAEEPKKEETVEEATAEEPVEETKNEELAEEIKAEEPAIEDSKEDDTEPVEDNDKTVNLEETVEEASNEEVIEPVVSDNPVVETNDEVTADAVVENKVEVVEKPKKTTTTKKTTSAKSTTAKKSTGTKSTTTKKTTSSTKKTTTKKSSSTTKKTTSTKKEEA